MIFKINATLLQILQTDSFGCLVGLVGFGGLTSITSEEAITISTKKTPTITVEFQTAHAQNTPTIKQ